MNDTARVSMGAEMTAQMAAADLAAASGTDPRVGLRAVLALRRLAERLEALQVDNARRQGWSWRDIAEALEVSKQAVHKKYAGRAPARGPKEG